MSFLKINRLGAKFPIKRIFADALFEWAGKFQVLRGVEGSLSYRHALGFVIAPLKPALNDRDLLLLERWDFETRTLCIRGKGEPPKSSFFHALIYLNRSGVIFAFHVTGPEIEKKAAQLTIPMLESSDTPWNDSVTYQKFEAKLGSGNLIHVPKVGVLSMGCTAEDAGTHVLPLLLPSSNF